MNDFDELRLKEILAFQGNVESLANPGECKQIVGSVQKLSDVPKVCLMSIIEIIHVLC